MGNRDTEEEEFKADFKGDLNRIEEIYKLKDCQNLETISQQKNKIIEMEKQINNSNKNFKNFAQKMFTRKKINFFYLFWSKKLDFGISKENCEINLDNSNKIFENIRNSAERKADMIQARKTMEVYESCLKLLHQQKDDYIFLIERIDDAAKFTRVLNYFYK